MTDKEAARQLLRLTTRSISEGSGKSFAPIISSFSIRDTPMTLDKHYQLLPLYTSQLPEKMLTMVARQLGKTTNLCAASGIRSGVLPHYHTLIIQPRFEQIQRMNNTIYVPMLKSCVVYEDFISKLELERLALKRFRNGSMTLMGNMYVSADKVRGVSGASCVIVDECVPGDTLVMCLDNSSDSFVNIPISEVKPGYRLISFGPSGIVTTICTNGSMYRGVRGCYKVTTMSGRSIICTEGHKLPTDKGPKRLSEVISDEYARRSSSNRYVGDSAECDSRYPDGGWEHIDSVREIRPCSLESWGKTEGICSGKVPDIARVRNLSTYYKDESRIRELLVCIKDQKYADTEGDTLHINEGEENDNPRVSGFDYTSYSTSLVVYGRRFSCETRKHGCHTHKRILGTGECLNIGLVDDEVGNFIKTSEGITLEHREHIIPANHIEGRLGEDDAVNIRICSGMHEIQNGDTDTCVPHMWEDIHCREVEQVVFGGVQESGYTGDRNSILQEDIRATHRILKGMETFSQKRTECPCTGSLQEPDGRTESTPSRVSQEVQGIPQRRDKCTKTSVSSKDEERSRVPGETKTRACCLLPEAKAGSREIQKENGCSARTSEEEKVNEGGFFYDPITSVEYVGDMPVYDIETLGTHNYILSNGICSYNCQDINYDFIPIVAETMSASETWASLLFAGTPLTTDTTLGLLWDQSSQAEWVIKCLSCNYYNIPNPVHDLENMIGKNGCVCAKCGKSINPLNGYYVHAIPSRMFTFPGYHLSQTVHPLHCMNPRKWMDLMGKVNSYSQQKLYNEVFGWPYDISVMPLTRKDVLAARNKHNHKEYTDVHTKDLEPYRYISVGIDFDGGGALSMSYTNLAVCGLRRDSNIIDCIYCKRYPKGRRVKEVADNIMSIVNRVSPDVIAYDAGGAGFVYRQILSDAGMEESLTIPFKYSSPSSGDVIRFHKGNRDDNSYYYSIDKSRSLAVIIEAVKNAAVTVPWFEESDPDPVPMELLSLVEQPKETASGGIIYLIGRKSSAPDDFAHALNFACSAIWDHFRSYPKLGVRYDIHDDDDESNGVHKIESDVWGDPNAWDEFASEINGPLYTEGGF